MADAGFGAMNWEGRKAKEPRRSRNPFKQQSKKEGESRRDPSRWGAHCKPRPGDPLGHMWETVLLSHHTFGRAYFASPRTKKVSCEPLSSAGTEVCTEGR